MLVFEVVHPALRALDHVEHQRDVVGVHAGGDALERDARPRLELEDAIDLLGPPDLAFPHVPGKVAQLRQPLRFEQRCPGTPQRLLGELRAVDVGDRAAPAHRLPRSVAAGDEVERQPARLTVHHDAEILPELRLAAAEMGGDCRFPPLAILGMEGEAAHPIGAVGESRVRRMADDLEHPRREVVLAGHQVPVHVAVGGGLHRQRVALLRKPPRPLGIDGKYDPLRLPSPCLSQPL